MAPASDKTRIAEALQKSGEILATAHVNPDGDALGSLIGFASALSGAGKSVTAFLDGGVPPHMAWLPESSLVLDEIPEKNYDVVVVLDCGDGGRSAVDLSAFPKAVKINIDHHNRNPLFGDLNYVRESASATAELVLEILDEMGTEPPPESATALYTAIHADTGGFRYSNASAGAFEASARLTRLGANPAFVAENLYERESPERTALLGKVLSSLRFHSGGKVAEILASRTMLAETGATMADTENFVNYPRSVEGVETAFFLKESDENVYRVTLRSKNFVDVAEIARGFGGGGHKRASGATIEGNLDMVREKILSAIEKELAKGAVAP